jgi:hypothetical protein
MKKFINWLIDALLPGEFDKGQGQYVVYKSIYDSQGYFMSTGRRVLLGCFYWSITVFFIYILASSWLPSDPYFDSTALNEKQLDNLIGRIFFGIFLLVVIINVIPELFFYGCERNPGKQALPKHIYLNLIPLVMAAVMFLLFGAMLLPDSLFASLSMIGTGILLTAQLALYIVKIYQDKTSSAG